MNTIALPAFHVTTTTTCSVKIDYHLSQDLQAYRQFYKQAYNAEVTEADLIREMARRFVESDREFQNFKSREAAVRKGRRPRAPSEAKTVVVPGVSSAAVSGGK